MRNIPLRLTHPTWALYLLWLFVLVFPKGGFKIGGVPLTWGYLFLGLCFIASLFRPSFSCQVIRIQALCLTLPFQALSALSFILYGIDNVPFAISFSLCFFFFPYLFFLCFSDAIDAMNMALFFKLLKKGIFFIAAYGIFLFFYKLFTLKFIEIPFLTTNFHDLGELDSKFINRGSVFKLISTYNNGNIYGICVLLFFPLYQHLEGKTWKKTVVAISLILSFSRTVWIGLLFSILIRSLFATKRISFSKLLLGSCLSLASIFFVTYIFGFNVSFLFDQNLGGRFDQLKILTQATLFPDKPFCGICEMVYLGIIYNFGLIGLFCYLLCMSAPILLALSSPSLMQKNILCGLSTFLLISVSDGALLFIPVLALYWFLSSLVLRKISFGAD